MKSILFLILLVCVCGAAFGQTYDTTFGIVEYAHGYYPGATYDSVKDETSYIEGTEMEYELTYQEAVKIDSLWEVKEIVSCPGNHNGGYYSSSSSYTSCLAIHYGNITHRKTISITRKFNTKIDLTKYYRFIKKSDFQ